MLHFACLDYLQDVLVNALREVAVRCEAHLVHQLNGEQICFDLLVYGVTRVCEMVDEECIEAGVLIVEEEQLSFQVTKRMDLLQILPQVALDNVREFLEKQESQRFDSTCLQGLLQERLGEEEGPVR